MHLLVPLHSEVDMVMLLMKDQILGSNSDIRALISSWSKRKGNALSLSMYVLICSLKAIFIFSTVPSML